MRLIRQERIRIDGLVVPVMREHLRIIEAIETRDPQRAAETLVEHINNARNRRWIFRRAPRSAKTRLAG